MTPGSTLSATTFTPTPGQRSYKKACKRQPEKILGGEAYQFKDLPKNSEVDSVKKQIQLVEFQDIIDFIQ